MTTDNVVPLTREQNEVLLGLRKTLVEKLKSGNAILADIENATEKVEANGIPSDFCLTNTGTYPILDEVYDLMFKLLFYVGGVDDTLLGVHEKLVRVKAGLEAIERSGVFIPADVQAFQDELREVDELDNGITITLTPGSKHVPMGQALLHTLLHKCHKKATKLLVATEVSPSLEPFLNKLSAILLEVNNLKGRADVTLEEITAVQDRLAALSKGRVDNKFVDGDGTVPEGQTVLINMLNKAYDGVHDLLSGQEQERLCVAPPLLPLYDELSSIRCELAVLKSKRFRHPVQLELRKIQQRLRDIDDERRDGKFLDIEGNVAAGNAVLHYLMARNFELCYDILCSEEAGETMDDLGPLYLLLVTSRNALKELNRRSGYDQAEVEAIQRGLQDVGKEIQRLELNSSGSGHSLRALYMETVDLLQWTMIRMNM